MTAVSTFGLVIVVLGALFSISRTRMAELSAVVLVLIGWVTLSATLLPPAATPSGTAQWLAVFAALIVGGVLSWLLAGVISTRSSALLIAAAAVVVIRVPIPYNGDSAMLLAPLYLVVGFGAIALARQYLTGRHTTHMDEIGGGTRAMDVAAVALLLTNVASTIWSNDATLSIEQIALFHAPFFLLYILCRNWFLDYVATRRAGKSLLAVAAFAALIAGVQAVTYMVWWNPKVIDANRFQPNFRVNSIFWDPNILGRFLVVALLLLGCIAAHHMLSTKPQRFLGIGLAILLTAALWATYSQTSWMALAAASLVLGILTLPSRSRRWVATITAIALVIASPFAVRQLQGSDVAGRQGVVQLGIDIAQENPVLGTGVGTFADAAQRVAQTDGIEGNQLVASHTSIITILAELGALGLIIFLLLATVTITSILIVWKRARAEGGDAWPSIEFMWATAALTALFAHSLLYAALLEDPMTWMLLALIASRRS